MNAEEAQLTLLLRRWSRGDSAAGDAVMGPVYKRIRQLAAGRMSADCGRQGFQPTELANELIIDLLEAASSGRTGCISSRPSPWRCAASCTTIPAAKPRCAMAATS